MCKIVHSRKSYKKESGFMEVMLDGDSTYEDVVQLAAETMSLEKDEDSTELLFRADGTMVPNIDVSVGGFSQRWTLQRYLKSLGKTAAQMKLGVGYRYVVCLCIGLCWLSVYYSIFRTLSHHQVESQIWQLMKVSSLLHNNCS